MDIAKEREKFFKRLEPFNRYFPTLEQTINKAFYSRLTVPDERAAVMVGLGYQCAATFDEIRFVCTNGYGLAGSKLLRGLYERVVTAAFFIKNPESAIKFVRSFDLDFGRLLHRNQEYFKAHGEDPNKILPPDMLKIVEDNFRHAKEEEEKCDCCGAPRGRVDVVSMAENAVPDLVPFLGLAYLEPTFHVHCTWYSIIDSAKATRDEHNHIDFEPYLEVDRALETLQLSHLVMLHAIENQSAYFNLELGSEIAERRKEYQKLWEEVAAVQ